MNSAQRSSVVVGVLIALVAGWLVLTDVRGCGSAFSPEKVTAQGAISYDYPEVDDSQIAPKDLAWLKAEPGRDVPAARVALAGLDPEDYRVDSGERVANPICRDWLDERKTQAGIVFAAALVVGVGGALAFRRSAVDQPGS